MVGAKEGTGELRRREDSLHSLHFFVVVETESCSVAQTHLELMILLPSLPSAKITGMYHWAQLHYRF
jgi:hypothetical protein